MEFKKYNFELPPQNRSIIKVIGVGGGGSNAVNHMFNQGIKDVEFIVCNTDLQALHGSPVPNKLQIGAQLTSGLGAGANPSQGRDAALESREDIREMLSDGTKMVFITAGMGGGTGTGAAPIIAEVAKDLGILTVGIVTAPFAFEGKKKTRQAQEGIELLKNNSDTVLVILNDKLKEIFGQLTLSQAFDEADTILTTAAKGIAEIITVEGHVNVDFEDVRTVMLDAGAAVMGSASAEGSNRAIEAAEKAISSPLLNNRNIHGAKKILLAINSGDEQELQMDELTAITEFIEEVAGEDAEMIFGHGVDPELGAAIQVTVIATGFEVEGLQAKEDDNKKVFDLESSKAKTEPVAIASDLDRIENAAAEQSDYLDSGEFEWSFKSYKRPTEKEDAQPKDEDVIDDKPNAVDSVYEFSTTEDLTASLQEKIERLKEKQREREERLAGIRKNEFDSNDMKEKLGRPAYQRQNVKLERTPSSSESSVSRYFLNEDGNVMGKNSFLHDNVD